MKAVALYISRNQRKLRKFEGLSLPCERGSFGVSMKEVPRLCVKT